MNLLQRAAIALALLVCLSTSLVAQAPHWSGAVQFPYAMGGDPGLESPAATVFNGTVYMVFTSRNAYTGGDFYMYEATSSDGLHYSSPVQINTQSGIAHAVSNPSLTVYNNSLYLAYNDAAGHANLVSSPDGVNWGAVQQLSTSVPVNSHPSIATDGQTLYIGLKENTTASGLVWCSYTLSGSSCITNESTGMNYGPGLALYGNTIYVGFEWQGNNHTLLYYTWQNGFFSPVQTVTGATTSAAPGLTSSGLALLYVGYRANDGGHGLYTTRLLANNQWDTSYYSGYGIGGPPAMFSGLPSQANTLFALYAANDSSHYIYAIGAANP